MLMMPRGTVDGMPCGNLVCVFCTVMIVDDDDDVNNNKVRTIHDKLLTTTTVIIVLLRYLEIIED